MAQKSQQQDYGKKQSGMQFFTGSSPKLVKRVSFSTDNTKDGAAEKQTADPATYIITLSKMEEWNEILDSPKPVVFQCSTSWCRPCQVLKPLMEKATAKHDGAVKFYYIDVEKFPEVGEMLQVSSVPHVFAVKGGQIVDEFTGVVSDKQIGEFMEKAIKSE